MDHTVHMQDGATFDRAYDFRVAGRETIEIDTEVHDEASETLYSPARVPFDVTWIAFTVPGEPPAQVRVRLHEIYAIDPPLSDGELKDDDAP